MLRTRRSAMAALGRKGVRDIEDELPDVAEKRNMDDGLQLALAEYSLV